MNGTPSEAGTVPTPSRRLLVGSAALLVLVTALVYLQVMGFGFVYDDSLYITQNARTLAGLDRHTLRWAFTTFEDGSYLPLVWLSHAACVQLFGLNPAGHHLVNLALHLANSVLMLLLLHRLTGSPWPSAAAAVLFAIHPLHVESVAWVSERKDVLSTLFWILTTLAYVAQVRRPTLPRRLATLALFALGLLSKSMLVTLPVTLLLLDIWPLRRMELKSRPWAEWFQESWPLVREKLPLFALAAVVGALTLWAQQRIGAMPMQGVLSLPVRVLNALHAVWTYLVQMAWPLELSAFYPHPGADIPLWKPAVAALALSGISVLCVRQAARRPYLLVGWLWYLITVLPVAGLVQVGAQASADRYTYVPLIGIFIALAWAVEEGILRLRPPRIAVVAGAAVLVGLLASLTFVQVGRWKDTQTLFGHALSLDPRNYGAMSILAHGYLEEGRLGEALAAYQRAREVLPDSPMLHYSIGDVLEKLGRPGDAMDSYRQALRYDSPAHLARYRLAHLLVEAGSFKEAKPLLELVLRVPVHQLHPRPDQALLVLQTCRCNRGRVLLSEGRREEGLAELHLAVALDPAQPWPQVQLGLALLAAGRPVEAVAVLRLASELEPVSVAIRTHLAEAQLAAGDPAAALATLDRVLAQRPGFPPAQRALEGLRVPVAAARTGQ